eukprot:COSAG01_NODE_47539_length_389_cov_1.010345_1_plen_75_part_01
MRRSYGRMVDLDLQLYYTHVGLQASWASTLDPGRWTPRPSVRRENYGWELVVAASARGHRRRSSSSSTAGARRGL